MQIDMHFYGIYALARAAGIKPDSAGIIAHASQFVDDALEKEMTELENHQVIFPIATAHRSMDFQNTLLLDQWNVWVPFHFLPGNIESGASFHEKMQCLKGSESITAGKILEHALDHKSESYGAHLAGITAHVYADTFSHFGFVGLNTDWNKVEFESIKPFPSSESILKYIAEKLDSFMDRLHGTLAETVPVGHGSVGTYPDRPYLKWEYTREKDQKTIVRNNLEDFLEACQYLYDFFVAFVTDNPGHGKPNTQGFEGIREKVRAILQIEENKEKRIAEWKWAIKNDQLYPATEEDKHLSYDDCQWAPRHIRKHLARHGSLKLCNASYFVHAAWIYRNYVLHDLLPEVGLVASPKK